MAAKHAVYNTNGSSVDDAVMWFYSNIENPAINEPLMIPNPKKGAAGAAGGDPDMVEPELDSTMISTLVQNGVPELAAKHAVHNTNGTSADDAIMWFYTNIENPIITEPLLIPNPNKKAGGGAAAGGGGYQADPEAMMMVTSMGFSDA
jgi:uncharacterized UBP type Zn finger protein